MKRSTPSKTTWIALAAGLCAAVAVYLYLCLLERDVAGGALHAVVALRADVPLGRRLREADFELRDLPERYLEERHVLAADLSRVVGATATSALSGGASLLWSDLDMAPRGKTLASLVSAGMRAFALSGRDLTFEGLLRAGDHVDVLFTRESGKDSATSTLLQNLLVLSVGTSLRAPSAVDEAEAAASPELVTLGVSVEQVPLLAHAAREGALQLSLRHPQDAVITQGLRPASAADLGQPEEASHDAH